MLSSIPYPMILLPYLLFLRETAAGPIAYQPRRDEQHFRFASLGDSWASGPAVIKRDAYGGPSNWNNCYQHIGAWEALMAGDDTWAEEPIQFSFASCSGATFNEVKSIQMGEVGLPELPTLQVGGNDANFGPIAANCIFAGDLFGFQRDYPDPQGSRFQALAKAKASIDTSLDNAGHGKSFYADHHQTLQAIMASDNLKNREDFYLYVATYAEIFNVSPGSDWCNKESFGIVRRPLLSNALRSKINELIRKFLQDVWLWNITSPEDDESYLTIQDADAHQSAWVENHTFINGTQATSEQLLQMLGSHSPLPPYSAVRSAHPKDNGHLAITEALMALVRSDKVPGVKNVLPLPPPPEAPPYSRGGRNSISINDQKPVYCKVGGYDPREGPECYEEYPGEHFVFQPDAVAIKQMDCYFPAPDWQGGPSSGE
ncbi:SGNH hydrolase-type esterase domain-containing protein [Rhexocercosporidium sp. MPI-PUGE-AT-0058]|nr:SGNH hydrolase-type esterase domain-containing protein [Rhexocercosporidium sp. MPI-PUGE-AT-0058]